MNSFVLFSCLLSFSFDLIQILQFAHLLELVKIPHALVLLLQFVLILALVQVVVLEQVFLTAPLQGGAALLYNIEIRIRRNLNNPVRGNYTAFIIDTIWDYQRRGERAAT